jgi:hypothetical protein
LIFAGKQQDCADARGDKIIINHYKLAGTLNLDNVLLFGSK